MQQPWFWKRVSTSGRLKASTTFPPKVTVLLRQQGEAELHEQPSDEGMDDEGMDEVEILHFVNTMWDVLDNRGWELLKNNGVV